MIALQRAIRVPSVSMARWLLSLCLSDALTASLGYTNKESKIMINFILWLLFGALVGWLASMVMRTDAQQGALMNIIVGIVGAFLGGLLFSFLPGSTSNINNSDFSLGGLLVSFVGAVVLLAIVNLATRGRVR
jgi:uncharacterized membrane protein YeaQ/YmgE (transglycosylase-associated protein family)